MADGVLVLALLAPLGATAVAFALEMPALQLTRATLLASAGAIIALLVAGASPVAGPFDPDPLAMAAAAGVALLAASVLTAADATVPAIAAVVVAGALQLSTTPGAALVGAVAGLALLAPMSGGWCSAAGAAGLTIASVAAVLDQHAHAQLATLAGGLGIAAVAVAARRGGPSVIVLPAVLVVGLRGLPAVLDISVRSRNTVAVMLAAGGLAVIALPRLAPLRRRVRPSGASSAIAPFALAAALGSVPGVASAAGLLSAGSVLGAALPAGLDAVAAIPGAVALCDALIDGRGTTAAVLGALAAAVAVVLLGQRERVARPGPVQVVAAGLTVWLVLRPTSWAWARPPDLERYTDGFAIAAAAGLAASTAAVAAGLVPLPALPAPVPAARPHRSTRDRVAALAITGALGCVAGALVRSGAL